MKKLFTLIALCALTLSASAAYRVYLCGITELTVDTLQSSTKNQFTLHFHQKCKNTAEYNKPTTFYESDVKLVLNSDDRTLEGTYTTKGASTTSSSANVNDQTINLITSEYTAGETNRLLRKDSISTFTIEKIGENQYAITTGDLFFSKRLDQTTDTWEYRYSYDASDILTQGIDKTPYIFGYTGGYQTDIYNYDMTVNGISVIRDDSDYDAIRYFLTLSCVGKNRENNVTRDYEVQLAIYPSEASIVGTYATQGGNLLYSSNCYVKDLKINKTRHLANDSISSIQIKSKGTNQYSFYGGTLICTDMDANYMAVYGKKRIEAVHYYHFSDNGGAGIEFGYDESNKSIELTISKVEAEAIYDGIKLEIAAKDANNIAYNVHIELESEQIDGSFTTANGLSLWSKVLRGSVEADVTSGSTITINAKSGNTHTISGSLLCENEYTYILKAFDFQYSNSTTGIENLLNVQRDNVQGTKVMENGVLYIMYKGTMYNVQGKRILD